MYWKNRCTHLVHQVHPFDKTGAPVLEDVSWLESTKAICDGTCITNFMRLSYPELTLYLNK